MKAVVAAVTFVLKTDSVLRGMLEERVLRYSRDILSPLGILFA